MGASLVTEGNLVVAKRLYVSVVARYSGLMETQSMTIRLPKELYERLRLAAFEDRTSQAAIITEGVELRLTERDRAKREASTAG